MDTGYFFKGVIIGFLVTTPVGPVGVICIRRMLTERRLVGFVSGLGAATADAIYAALAVFGLTFISGVLVHQQVWLRLLAGLFLLFLGGRIFRDRPSIQLETPKVIGLVGDFVTAFLLALSNPMLILSLVAIFAALNLTIEDGGYSSAGLLVSGVFSGSALWWVLLALASGIWRLRFTEPELRWINRISGSIITCFGLAVLLSLGLWRC